MADPVDEDFPPLPKHLSPSRAMDFEMCPAKYFYGAVMKLPTPASEAATIGTVAHACLEKLFALPAEKRTEDTAASFVLPSWLNLCGRGKEPAKKPGEYGYATQQAYADLAPADSDMEKRILAEAQVHVLNEFKMERVQNFNPVGLELKARTKVNGVPLYGIVDRLDEYEATDKSTGEKVKVLVVSDYKTGKVPDPDSRWFDKTMREKWFAMDIYAALIEAELGRVPKVLRLIFLKAGDKSTGIFAREVTPQILRNVKGRVKDIWSAIKKAHKERRFEAKENNLCNWCDFKDVCPVWNPELEGMPLDGFKGAEAVVPVRLGPTRR